MRKALILGTNAGQADIITYLKENNWDVHSCGHKKEGPGCNLAHKFHLVNTIDKEAVKELAAKIEADIVYSVSSDSAIRTATWVSEKLKMPTLLNSDIIDLFHYKERLREFLNLNNINTVKYKKINSIDQIKDWNIVPCVVKPSDSQGQRGVELIEDIEKLYKSVDNALKQSSTNTAIIEEYLEGVEISTNMLIQNYNVILNEFTERLVHGKEYFGLPKGHSIPIRSVPENNIQQAKEIVIELVEKLKIKDAVLYIQLKVTENGPKIIEVAPRLDGCHIWRLLKHARGYDLRQYAIDCLTGNKINHKVADENTNYTLKFHQLPTYTLFDESLLSFPENIEFNEYRYKKYEEIPAINGKLEVVGYYITKD